jgi:hypothetical protein
MWNLVLARLKTVLASEEDRCTACAKCTIWLEIILDAPVMLLGDKAHVEARFGPFGDSA